MRTPILLLTLSLFTLFSLVSPVSPGGRADSQEEFDRRVTPVVEVVRKVGPAVVNIAATHDIPVRDPFYSWLYGSTQTSRSLGSGVVIDPDGYVVTNAHVVQGGDWQVNIKVGSSEPTGAEIIWIDKGNDLALLKIAGRGPFPHVELGTSSDIMIGETVLALGNPYGFDNTVSQGIVSATNRTLATPTGASFVDFIQTDAALHPGNSGGPLANINGDLIGINTLVQSGTEAIGFAIPIDRVRKILLERLSNFAVIRGVYLGARVSPGERDEARVHFVERGSPADLAGLRQGDVIRSLDDQAVDGVFDFNKRMLETAPGQTIALALERGPDRLEQVEVRLGVHSQNPEEILWQRLGMRVTDRDRLNRKFKGVMVLEVQPDGPADRIGLAARDFLYRLGGREIESFESFYYAVTESTEEWLQLDVIRGREQYQGEITLRALREG